MLKDFAWLINIVAIVTALSSFSHAQNAQFTYFQCSPTSCEEEGPPSTTESVEVELASTCQSGLNIDKTLTVTLLNCSVPYIPYALIQRSRTTYYDDTGCTPKTYNVDYATFNAEVFTGGGVVVYHQEFTDGCDGSIGGPTTFGAYPC